MLLGWEVVVEPSRIIRRLIEEVFAAVAEGTGPGVPGGREVKEVIGVAALDHSYVDFMGENLWDLPKEYLFLRSVL